MQHSEKNWSKSAKLLDADLKPAIGTAKFLLSLEAIAFGSAGAAPSLHAVPESASAWWFVVAVMLGRRRLVVVVVADDANGSIEPIFVFEPGRDVLFGDVADVARDQRFDF